MLASYLPSKACAGISPRRSTRLFFSVVLFFVIVSVRAQIPFFAPTVGQGKLYAYTSFKCRPGIHAQETYSTLQYGLVDRLAAGIDFYTNGGDRYLGGLLRAGYQQSKWFGIGGQVMPTFQANDNFRFAYLTSGLFMNGAITSDGQLFWTTNTWWGIYNGTDHTLTNWEYLGYGIPLKRGNRITPMVGVIHSWKFDQDVDISAGFYYTIKNWNLYLWGNDFLKKNPRFIIGVDVVI